MQTTTNHAAVAEALQNSGATVGEMLDSIDAINEAQNRLLVDLLQHETAHQGQLIRYLYGLRLPIPESWKVKYALD